MPVNPFANLGNMIKAFTTGVIQSVAGNKNPNQTKSTEPEFIHTAEESANDHVALSDEAAQESTKAETPPEQPQVQTPQNFNPRPQSELIDEQNASALSRSSQSQGAQKGEGVQNAQPLVSQEFSPEPQQPMEGADHPPAMELQKLLQGWLQLDPKTITGLERFLEVEFSHYPEDYQLFMNMRMMTMLKQARRLMEEQKLFAAENEQSTAETPEGSTRAMVGAALMGYAYYKVLRKRAKIKDRFGVGIGGKEIAGEQAEGERGAFASLQEADHFLKEAEKELQRAMFQGLDNDQIRQMAGKVLDICAQIAEMQVSRLPSSPPWDRRARQPVG